MKKRRLEWIQSIWSAVEAGQRIDWADFEWYAIDRCDAVGMLTTAGPGQVPRSVFANITSYITVLEYFNDLPKLGRATLFDHPGRLDDWRAMAERGLYAFDFMCISRQTTGYRLVSRPQEALLLSAIPSRIQKYFDAVRFSTVSFADAGEDALNLTVETIEWL